jgi:hypothetical protein
MRLQPALFLPQGRFATCMAQARSADHFVLRISSEWAAS